jgi:hypothetical protein
MDQPTNPQPLDYAARPAGRRKRIIATVLLVVVVGTISGVWHFWGTQIERHFKLLYLQHQCMNYTAQQVTYMSPSTFPKAVSEFCQMMNIHSAENFGLVFSHEIRASTGQRFLFIVLDNRYEDESHSRLALFTAGDLFHDPKTAPADWDEQHVNVDERQTVDNTKAVGTSKFRPALPDGTVASTGQIDPADSSHFAFRSIDDGNHDDQTDIWLGNVDANGRVQVKIVDCESIP